MLHQLTFSTSAGYPQFYSTTVYIDTDDSSAALDAAKLILPTRYPLVPVEQWRLDGSPIAVSGLPIVAQPTVIASQPVAGLSNDSAAPSQSDQPIS